MLFQGSDEKERPINLTFDWQKKRVTGVAKERAVDLELPDGAQDAMSMQIASMRDLASGDLKGTVWMIDSTKLKDYELHLEGNARIATELGELDTVIYSSRRDRRHREPDAHLGGAGAGLSTRQGRAHQRQESADHALIQSSTGRCRAGKPDLRSGAARNVGSFPVSRPGTSGLRQRDALLALVLAAAILVRGRAHFVGLEEQHLRHALVGVDLRGQRRGVGELQRHVPFPLGLERRDVDDDAAARVRRLARGTPPASSAGCGNTRRCAPARTNSAG